MRARRRRRIARLRNRPPHRRPAVRTVSSNSRPERSPSPRSGRVDSPTGDFVLDCMPVRSVVDVTDDVDVGAPQRPEPGARRVGGRRRVTRAGPTPSTLGSRAHTASKPSGNGVGAPPHRIGVHPDCRGLDAQPGVTGAQLGSAFGPARRYRCAKWSRHRSMARCRVDLADRAGAGSKVPCSRSRHSAARRRRGLPARCARAHPGGRASGTDVGEPDGRVMVVARRSPTGGNLPGAGNGSRP